MARPRKDYLEYFPFSVHVLDDPKMMMALNDGGSDVFAVYVAVLAGVYGKSYWVPKDSPDLMVIPAKLHMPTERVDAAYDVLVANSLVAEIPAATDVEKSLCQCGVAVTSRGMQKQYFESKKRVITKELPFLLLECELLEENPQF